SDDQGTYTCRATNKSGEDMTQANVSVQVHTLFLHCNNCQKN
ncbi:MAG: hypothetical protein GY696_38485, partial [Gammaproteobacteria bacterium]|nr:hypothetical protein [Gammaproteobacteria bacterium]